VNTPGDDAAVPTRSRIDRRRREARSQPSQSYLRRRQELELAAAAVMRRKGFHDMTLRDLADEVGAERASIYYYVAGKEELLADMVLRALMENQAALEEIAGRPDSAADKVRAFIRVLMSQFDRHFPYLYIWVHEDFSRFEGIGKDELDRIVDLSQRDFEFIEGVIGEGVAAGEFVTSLPVGVVAQSVIGLVAWSYRWYEPGHTLSADQLADGLADIALRGLTGPAAG
jgi:TetR/AcrR family transcriptional regulator, cholesterol catabolism regulator